MLIVPNIAGFVGADTISCILASGTEKTRETTLPVAIGTNGEMALGNRERRIACSTAAGPALEGANISCGMQSKTGAIDLVRMDEGKLFHCHREEGDSWRVGMTWWWNAPWCCK